MIDSEFIGGQRVVKPGLDCCRILDGHIHDQIADRAWIRVDNALKPSGAGGVEERAVVVVGQSNGLPRHVRIAKRDRVTRCAAGRTTAGLKIAEIGWRKTRQDLVGGADGRAVIHPGERVGHVSRTLHEVVVGAIDVAQAERQNGGVWSNNCPQRVGCGGASVHGCGFRLCDLDLLQDERQVVLVDVEEGVLDYHGRLPLKPAIGYFAANLGSKPA